MGGESHHMITFIFESGGILGGMFAVGVVYGLTPWIIIRTPAFFEASGMAIGPRTVRGDGDFASVHHDSALSGLRAFTDAGMAGLPIVAVIKLIAGSGIDFKSISRVFGAEFQFPITVSTERGSHHFVVFRRSGAGDFSHTPHIMFQR